MKAPWKRINDADVYVNWVWGRERVTVTQDKWHIDEARLEILKKFVPETLIPIANHELSDYEAERA